eukprot:1142774-Pelagomonas_calceolata.AAC.2
MQIKVALPDAPCSNNDSSANHSCWHGLAAGTTNLELCTYSVPSLQASITELNIYQFAKSSTLLTVRKHSRKHDGMFDNRTAPSLSVCGHQEIFKTSSLIV